MIHFCHKSQLFFATRKFPTTHQAMQDGVVIGIEGFDGLNSGFKSSDYFFDFPIDE